VTDLKTRTIVKCAVLAVSLAVALSTTNSYADVHSSADLIKVQSSAVFHAIRGNSLAGTLAQIAQRSGISFKINTDLGKDVVSQSIAADNWNNAVRSLLVNYNFTIIQDSDTIKTVIISGGNNHAVADTDTANAITASTDDVNDFESELLPNMPTEQEWSDGDKPPRSGSAPDSI
jgi:hypothetical protein